MVPSACTDHQLLNLGARLQGFERLPVALPESPAAKILPCLVEELALLLRQAVQMAVADAQPK